MIRMWLPWDQDGVNMGSGWGNHGIMMGLICDQDGVIMGSGWSYHGI